MAKMIEVIPCLDMSGGRVVKGVKFEELRDAGDAVHLAKEYYRSGADEVVFLDVSASAGGKRTMDQVVLVEAFPQWRTPSAFLTLGRAESLSTPPPLPGQTS